MAQFKKKQTSSFWYSPLVLIVFFCILVLFAYNMIGLIKKEQETSKNKISQLKKIEELNKREAALSEDIERLNTPEGIEESVRDKFQVVKPGEKEVLIVSPTKSTEPSKDVKDHTFWGYIKRMFGRK